MRLLLHSLRYIDVTRDTSQASMAPCVEPASQSAPVPDSQGPFFEEWQYISSPDPLKLPPHAPTHPNSAACSALRSAGVKTTWGVQALLAMPAFGPALVNISSLPVAVLWTQAVPHSVREKALAE